MIEPIFTVSSFGRYEQWLCAVCAHRWPTPNAAAPVALRCEHAHVEVHARADVDGEQTHALTERRCVDCGETLSRTTEVTLG
jgi:hypothetical protein